MLSFFCGVVWFSTLSKYGVHGFPTIILMNSTMLVVYRGSRALDSLVAFYSDVTGKVFELLLWLYLCVVVCFSLVVVTIVLLL